MIAVSRALTNALFAGSRSSRLINPHAYEKGAVFVQCRGCEVWHMLVDNQGIVEEYDLTIE
jgi:mitochondrial protein import protein ZIM17